MILVVVRGGASAEWPPDRPVEWIAIALVFGLVVALFLACVTIGWWYPRPRRARHAADTAMSPLVDACRPRLIVVHES